ncbi:hypothetical protein RIF29_33820 [Crotalaria pallida]|uniref:K Homology domain-containing protein n=1 Tax=Crotalaria pallida TaxID=3830 RepID=A0AAN9HQX3_CROPI
MSLLLLGLIMYVLGKQKKGNYWNLICSGHKSEISSLVLCRRVHDKLQRVLKGYGQRLGLAKSIDSEGVISMSSSLAVHFTVHRVLLQHRIIVRSSWETMAEIDQHFVGHETEQIIENSKPGQNEGPVAARGGAEKKWPGWPGQSVFRMLVPAQKVGAIIGRKGELIKKIVEETRARVKILGDPRGTSERAVMVSGKEEPESFLPPAVDALLRIHKILIDGLESDSYQATSSVHEKFSMKLLVQASQAGSLIGRDGSTVKSFEEASHCTVKVHRAEALPIFALPGDRVVEAVGDSTAVHKAIKLIALHLRKFLVDRRVLPVFEMNNQMANPHGGHQVEQIMPPLHQSRGQPQGAPVNVGGGPSFGHTPRYVPPPQHLVSYYPPPAMPPPVVEKQLHQSISYGSNASIGVHAPSNIQYPRSVVTQNTWRLQIPRSYADAVIGYNGNTISYIRRASGTNITIQETRGVLGEVTVDIIGTASGILTAQQLIQNVVAEAALTQPQQGYYGSGSGSVYGYGHGH